MFRRLRQGRGPDRWVIPAAFVVLFCGGILQLADDAPTSGITALQATQGFSPLPVGGPPTSATPSVQALASPPETEPVPVAGTTAAGTEPAVGAGGTPGLAAPDVPAAVAEPATPPPGPPAAGSSPAATARTDTTSPAPANIAAAAATPTTTSPATTAPPTAAAPTTTTVPPSRGPARSPGLESEIAGLTNRDRSAAGLGPLARNACVDGAASGYAEQMAGRAVMAHHPGAGAAIAGCRPGAAWGDNVGTAGPCSAALLEERWMASPGHHRNIVTAGFTQIGVGVWTDEKGTCWAQVLFSS